MALIRWVSQHSVSQQWAYIEKSDETGHISVLGGKEFDTEEEVVEFSKGFKPFCYTWEDPKESKKVELIAEYKSLKARLQEIEQELSQE